MATRGSAMSRAIKFFKEEDLDVALVALTHIRNIVDARSRRERPAPAPKQRRKPKAKGAAAGYAGGEAPYQDESESLANA